MKNKYKVSYQGMPGAFSQLAIDNFFNNQAIAVSKKSFFDAFNSVLKDQTDFAIIPFKNSTTGDIKVNHNLQKKYNLKIVGQIKLRIAHNLLAYPLKGRTNTRRIEMIKKAYSHPQALKQCTQFFKKHSWIKPIATNDTAGSAKLISIKGKHDIAAIASLKAAVIYDLQVLLKNIENRKNNYTFFWILGFKK